jgi:hypothetical protein
VSVGLAPTTFGRHLLRAGLLLLPVGYVAQLLATATHEFLGHGLTALLIGGRFTGLSLAWDGMGSAAVQAPEGAGSDVAILAGGVTSTCVAGLLLLVVAPRLRNGPGRWVFLVLSAAFLLEGAPYAFWSAWQVEDRGDIGRILLLLEDAPDGHAAGWRAAILAAGALLTLLGTVLPLGRLLADVEASFPPSIDLTAVRRTVLATVFGVAGMASWWLFDWEQLVSGLGVLPQVSGSLLIAGTAAWFILRRGCGDRTADFAGIPVATMATWWTAAVVGLAATGLWLGEGVRWTR